MIILPVPVDPCTPTPCANNGNCMVTGLLNYTCECTPGYTGPTCDDEIGGCPTMSCPSNSICDNVNGAKCVCLPGFQLNGGMCVELLATGEPGMYVIVHIRTKRFQLVFNLQRP